MTNLIAKIKHHFKANPAGLYVLFYTEMWELFGRFSITALLVLYLTKMFHTTDAKAFTVYSAFIALYFITPIIGGYLSDRYLGSHTAVIFGGITMAVGNSLLIIPIQHIVYIGLAIIALGNGFYAPTLAALVGNLYKHGNQNRDKGFTIYYIGKNIGALLGPIMCGIVAQEFGFNYAFILSTIGILSGLAAFILGKKRLPQPQIATRPKPLHEKSHLRRLNKTLIYLGTIAVIPLATMTLNYNVDGYLLTGAGIASILVILKLAKECHQQERRNILYIVTMMLFVLVFSAFLYQGGTTLNLFIDRLVNRNILGYTIPTSFLFTLDPIFMILLGPLLTLAFAFRDRRKHFSEVYKFAIALLLLGLGFAVFMLASIGAAHHNTANMGYIVLAYMIFPLAELCILPIGLSLTTRYAPKHLESMMVGIFMLATAAATYMTGIISKIGQIKFNIIDIASAHHAAHIYTRLFVVSSSFLIIIGILLFLANPFLSKLIRYQHKSNGTKKTLPSTALEI